MGCFGYICNKCKLSIREDEKAVLRHIRHGVLLGETEGTYDSYGRVLEDPVFRSWEKDNLSELNNHEEICKSEFDLLDSMSRRTLNLSTKNYNNTEVGLTEFLEMKYEEDTTLPTIEQIATGEVSNEKANELLKAMAEFNNLPVWQENFTPKSGIAAFHAKCYHSLEDNESDNALRVTPSESDPDQSWGTPRKRFM